jgi:hypothetical protein
VATSRAGIQSQGKVIEGENEADAEMTPFSPALERWKVLIAVKQALWAYVPGKAAEGRRSPRHAGAKFGYSREREASWSAVAARQRRRRFLAEDEVCDFHPARACESGVALHFPPQSKTPLCSDAAAPVGLADDPSVARLSRRSQTKADRQSGSDQPWAEGWKNVGIQL